MIIGLTGKNGSGKGEAASFLKERGFHYYSLSDALREEAGKRNLEICRDSLVALRDIHGDISYNLVFHTAPHHYNGSYHWHVHLFPKLVTTAGFERGTGVMINIVPPETAAAQLRNVAVKA